MKIRLFRFALGGFVLIACVMEFNGRTIGSEVLQAGWSIPVIIGVHLVQLFLSACAWRLTVGKMSIPRLRFFRVRTIREGVNSLLPVAQIGGQIVGVRLITQMGIGLPSAVAGTTLDLTLETTMQLVFIGLAIALLQMVGVNAEWVAWARGCWIVGAIGVLSFVLAQRAGLLRLIEFLETRLNETWPTFLKTSAATSGLHDQLMRLQRKRWMLSKASVLHLLSWSFGATEVCLVLFAMGHSVGFIESFIVESLGMAARSVGFAIPGALGVQEGGFILVCGLFGVPPHTAIALSVVKRLREVFIGLAGLIMWQWSEMKRTFSVRSSS